MSYKPRWRVHVKVACQVLPLAVLVAVEGRDMYYRARWDVTPMSPAQLAAGDVILLSNRWYTLPTWRQVCYSFACKLLFKTSWDEVAVVVRTSNNNDDREATAQIMYCDFDGVHTQPVDTFLRTRRPRGAAVRRLRREPPSLLSSSSLQQQQQQQQQEEVNASPLAATPPQLSPDITRLFLQEVQKLRVRPWYVFAASWRGDEETDYYDHMVRMYMQRCKIRALSSSARTSLQAIEAERGVLREMEQQRERLARQLTQGAASSLSSSQRWPFHLFSGSLVASFYATFGLLPRDLPAPTRYVPQDFTEEVPLCGTNILLEPLVFFRT